MRGIFIQRKGVTPKLLLKQIHQAGHTEIALAVAQHNPCAPLEAIQRGRRQWAAHGCKYLAARNRPA